MNGEKSTDTLKLNCLMPENICFSRNANGFLVMSLCGEAKGRVKLTRAYPYAMPFSYIGVSDIEDKEIGIIKEISELDEESEKLAKEELISRYFCPMITEITSIKERMGNFYFETKVGNKDKSFTVKDISRNIRMQSDNCVLIFDVDGNRYEISQFDRINKKTRRLLEPYLY